MVRTFFDPFAIFKKQKKVVVPTAGQDRAEQAREASKARAEARRRARARRGTASTVLTATGASTGGVLTAKPNVSGS